MKIINFFGSSGAGKSTHSLRLSTYFKEQQIKAEYVPEYPKYLVYSQHNRMLMDQFKIFAEQRHYIDILRDHKIDYAVCDSPLLLGLLYGEKYNTVKEDFAKVILNEFNTFDNVNFFVSRSVPFDEVGRVESMEESDDDSNHLRDLLIKNQIDFIDIDTKTSVNELLKYIK